MSLNPGLLREVMGNFATGCTVVTLPGEPPHGMTANAFSSVSIDPPLCLISVDHETTTYEKLDSDVDTFCVNVLSEEQKDLAEHFAGMDELEEDPFESRPTRTETTDAPVFEDSLAYIDCTVDSHHRTGDHTLYIGAIESTEVLDDADPLTFFRGQWGTIDQHAAED
jgi:flavin reductase (DIM6/NTAB) family NADH-FMN oxidoreductase RutF